MDGSQILTHRTSRLRSQKWLLQSQRCTSNVLKSVKQIKKKENKSLKQTKENETKKKKKKKKNPVFFFSTHTFYLFDLCKDLNN